MDKVYLCKEKVGAVIFGSPFVVLTEAEAKKWKDEDPETHVVEEVPVKKL